MGESGELQSMLALAEAYEQANWDEAGKIAERLGIPDWDISGRYVKAIQYADEVFTASGGSIVCRFAVIDDDTVSSPVTDPLVCFSLLDNAPADVTATDTNTLTIAMNASGIFTLAT